MMLAIFMFAALLFSIFAAYKSAYRGATQYWGVKMAIEIGKPEKSKNELIFKSFESITVHGLRDAITTGDERFKKNISAFLNLGFFIVGVYFFSWPVGIFSLFGILLAKTFIRHQLPVSNSEGYKRKIIQKMERESRIYGFLQMKKKKEKADFFLAELEKLA